MNNPLFTLYLLFCIFLFVADFFPPSIKKKKPVQCKKFLDVYKRGAENFSN